MIGLRSVVPLEFRCARAPWEIQRENRFQKTNHVFLLQSTVSLYLLDYSEPESECLAALTSGGEGLNLDVGRTICSVVGGHTQEGTFDDVRRTM